MTDEPNDGIHKLPDGDKEAAGPEMVLVPRVPTPAMLADGWYGAHDEDAELTWQYMVEAWEAASPVVQSDLERMQASYSSGSQTCNPAPVPSRESTLPELDELLKAAKAATPGPWMVQHNLDLGNLYIKETGGNFGRVARVWNERTCTEENAEFIAKANPSAVIELISALTAARAQVALLQQQEPAERAWYRAFQWADDHGSHIVPPYAPPEKETGV